MLTASGTIHSLTPLMIVMCFDDRSNRSSKRAD
jgi:hypothetical protein